MWFEGMFNIYLFGGSLGKGNRKKLAQFKNNVMFQNVFSRYVQDALQRYEFDGLPETISERVLKQSLLWYGGVCVFEKDGALLALPCAPTGDGFNIYGDPSQVWVFARNGQFNKQVDVFIHGSDESAFLLKGMTGRSASRNPKGVYIWENALRYPFINQTMFYSRAVADTMRTLDVCRVNIKNPYIIVAEESVVNTVKQYFASRDNNEEFIISSGVFSADKVQLLPITTNAENLTACTSLIEWYENQYKMLCGVENNAQMDKKGENLISSEVEINKEYTEFSVDKATEYIQRGLDDVNKLFGTNITVKEKEGVKDEDEIEDVSRDPDTTGSVPDRA